MGVLEVVGGVLSVLEVVVMMIWRWPWRLRRNCWKIWRGMRAWR